MEEKWVAMLAMSLDYIVHISLLVTFLSGTSSTNIGISLKLKVVALIIGPFESKELGDGVDIKCHQWNFVRNLIHFLQFVHLKFSNILIPHHIVQSPFLFLFFIWIPHLQLHKGLLQAIFQCFILKLWYGIGILEILLNDLPN